MPAAITSGSSSIYRFTLTIFSRAFSAIRFLEINMTSRNIFIWTTMAALSCSRAAWAHAFPDHSDPRVGSTVHESPEEVKIWFDREIEPAFSTIQVLTPDGTEIDKK